MAKTSGGIRGDGRYSTQIASARRLYSEEKQIAFRAYNEQLRELEQRGLTEQEYNMLSRNVSYYKNNPKIGTKREFDEHIADHVKMANSGDYREGIMEMSSGLGGDVVRNMAHNAAQREVLPRIKRLLVKYNRR